MFRFFRRKKSKEENKVSQESVAAPELEEAEAVELVEREQDVQTPEALVTVSSHEPEEVVVESSSPPPAELESTPASSPTSEAAQVSVEERVFDSDSEPTVTDSAEDAIVASDAGLATSPETTEKLALAPVAEVVEEQSVQETAPKASWMQRLRQGLSRTGSNIGALFVGVKVDEELFEELETALLMADAGIEATESLLTKLRAKVKQQRIEEGEQVKEALKELLTEHLKPLEKSFMLPLDGTSVVMIAGVNGAGKTTSIGKLAHHFQASGASVLLAAGDTFRAAAREQLVEWGKRNNVAVISQD